MMRAMKLSRLVRVILKVVAAVVLAAIVLVSSVWIYFHPNFERTNGLVYGQRHGHDLTIDVVRPTKPNGIGIALMVSGGWNSPFIFYAYSSLVVPGLLFSWRGGIMAGLEEIDLSCNQLGDEGIRALAASKQLGHCRSLSLGENQIGIGGIAALAAHAHLPNLPTLDLAGNAFEDGGIAVLSRFIATTLPILSHLHVARNRLTDRAAHALALETPGR